MKISERSSSDANDGTTKFNLRFHLSKNWLTVNRISESISVKFENKVEHFSLKNIEILKIKFE